MTTATMTLDKIFDKLNALEMVVNAHFQPDYDEFISEKEATNRYGMSVSWFRFKRLRGDGPEYSKVGSRILYRTSVLDRFFNSRVKKSTSQYSKPAASPAEDIAQIGNFPGPILRN